MDDSSGIIKYLEAAIQAEGVRQSVLANNIANINTPGYRRLDIKFEELLAKALDSAGSAEATEIKPEIFQPKNTTVKANGNDVSLNSEFGEIIKNTMRHRTFLRLLRKRYDQMQLAIRAK